MSGFIENSKGWVVRPPMFKDRCNHSKDQFVCRIMIRDKAHDLYLFEDDFGWQYCARYGDRDDQYRSGSMDVGRTGFVGDFSDETKIEILQEKLDMIRIWLEWVGLQKRRG